MKSRNTTIYLTFILLGLAIWVDSLWIKVPVTLMMIFSAYAMTKEIDYGNN